jgi:hypothetical protein
MPGAGLRVAFLRAPYAHARLQSLDYSAAASATGVRLVASQADLDADQVGDIHCQLQIENFDGSKMPMTTKPAMVRDINRYAGDIVAMVVADTQTQANDAVDLNHCPPLPTSMRRWPMAHRSFMTVIRVTGCLTGTLAITRPPTRLLNRPNKMVGSVSILTW